MSEIPPPHNPVPRPEPMSGWAALGNGQVVELATPGARLGARLLDWLIVTAVWVAFVLVLIVLVAAVGGVLDLVLGAVSIICMLALIVATIAYEPFLTTRKGQTYGKMICNIKVVQSDNGMLPTVGKSIGRWGIPFLAAFVPFLQLIVYASLLWDSNRQGWHDHAVDTLVIKT